MKKEFHDLYLTAQSNRLFTLRKFIFLYVALVIGVLFIIVSSEDKEDIIADVCESSCYSGCIGNGGTSQYCETYCDNELVSCVEETISNPGRVACESEVSQKLNECIHDINCVDMGYMICDGTGSLLLTAPEEDSWEWEDCWGWCRENSYGLNDDTICPER